MGRRTKQPQRRKLRQIRKKLETVLRDRYEVVPCHDDDVLTTPPPMPLASIRDFLNSKFEAEFWVCWENDQQIFTFCKSDDFFGSTLKGYIRYGGQEGGLWLKEKHVVSENSPEKSLAQNDDEVLNCRDREESSNDTVRNDLRVSNEQRRNNVQPVICDSFQNLGVEMVEEDHQFPSVNVLSNTTSPTNEIISLQNNNQNPEIAAADSKSDLALEFVKEVVPLKKQKLIGETDLVEPSLNA